MIELIIKMILCLVVALILGFIIGWLLTKISQSKKYLLEVDVLNSTLDDRNERIEILEKQFVEKETTLLKVNHTNRELKESLVEKTTLLNTNSINLIQVEKELNFVKSAVVENDGAKEHNQVLSQKVTELESTAKNKNQEIEELEAVLIKAEQIIEEKEKLFLDKESELAALNLDKKEECLPVAVSKELDEEMETLQNQIDELSSMNEEKENSIALYQDTISELEKELKLYCTNGEEDEFVISKDQFTHIEDQLGEYQKEITLLKEENSRLVQVGHSNGFHEKSMSDDLDDGSIVKLFRETYKKITKS